jgi:hypothetical protein
VNLIVSPLAVAAAIFFIGVVVLPWVLVNKRFVFRHASALHRMRSILSGDEANQWAFLFSAIFTGILWFDAEPLGYAVAIVYPLVCSALLLFSDACEVLKQRDASGACV